MFSTTTLAGRRVLKMRGVDLVRVHGAILGIFHWTKRDQRKHRRGVCVGGWGVWSGKAFKKMVTFKMGLEGSVNLD